MSSQTIIQSLQPILGPDKLTELDYAATGCHVRAEAQPDQMPAVAAAMLEQKCYLESLTALDQVESFEVVYHFASFTELCRTVVHVPLAVGVEVPDHQPGVSCRRLV